MPAGKDKALRLERAPSVATSRNIRGGARVVPRGCFVRSGGASVFGRPDAPFSLYLRTGGLVLFQVGTEFVTPTEGQLYDPTDGAVTVPTVAPDDAKDPDCVVVAGTPVIP